VSVLDATGKVIREVKVASEPEALVAFLRGLDAQRPPATSREAVWPVETSVAFANAVLEAMPGLRTPVQRDARLALAAMRAPLDPETVRTALHAVAERLESAKRCRNDSTFPG
jgi:hypothetical protein